MKTRYLFPYSFKKVGWILLIPAVLVGLLMVLELVEFPALEIKVFSLTGQDVLGYRSPAFRLTENNVLDELVSMLIIVGALLVACSEEKTEDEYIARIRLESLLWATYANYGLLLLAIVLVYDLAFLQVMMFNMVTLLLLFLIRFNFILYRNTKANRHEEYA
ncbi:MAG: hypothetical protein ACO1O1_03955 [Adhaeribacter sp.]